MVDAKSHTICNSVTGNQRPLLQILLWTKEIFKMKKESISRPMNLSHDIFPRFQPQYLAWCNTYGMNFLYWIGPKAKLVVTESELVKEILNNKEKAYPQIDLEGYQKKLFGDGIATSEGEKWAKLRKLVNHAFRAESLKNMVPAMIASVDMMLERWKQYEGKEVDVSEELRVLTSEVISRTAFGSSYLEGKDIFEKLTRLGIIISRNSLKIRLPVLSKFYKSSDDVESDKLEQGIRDSIIGIIKKREKTANGEVDNFGTDYLGLLVKANHPQMRTIGLQLKKWLMSARLFTLLDMKLLLPCFHGP